MPRKKKKAKKSKPAKRRPAKKKSPKPAAKKAKVRAKAKAAPARKAAPAPRKGAPLPLAPKTPKGIPGEKFLGKVEDFFGKISVIAFTVKESLSLGDTIHVLGHTTDFTEEVKSMQMDHNPLRAAKRGDSVGIKVANKARKGDNVYRVG